MKQKLIHLCGYANQLAMQTACDRSWGQPMRPQRSLTPDVYDLDDGRLYTFDAGLVTCAACKVWVPA